MQSTDQVCEHQNANYLAMMRERDAARAALAAERDRADRAEARPSLPDTDYDWAVWTWQGMIDDYANRVDAESDAERMGGTLMRRPSAWEDVKTFDEDEDEDDEATA